MILLKIKKYLISHIHEAILFIISTLYLINYTAISFIRHENFYSRRFDLGNMDQTVWNTLHGNIFMFTDPYGTEQISRLAYHADFILILLAPFYILWSDPKMLLLIQTFFVVLGGIFVYLIALKILINKTVALAITFSYLHYPAIIYANLYDFHGAVLGATFLLAAFYFILSKNWWLVVFFLILAALTKEQVWAVTAIFGFYIFFISKKRILGSLISSISIGIFISLLWYIIPSFAPAGHHFALIFLYQFGNTPTEIVIGIIANPIEVLKVVFAYENIIYLSKLFLPVGFLPIFGFPLLIFAIPDLAINLLSDNQSMKEIRNQYPAIISPFIYLAAIYGINFLHKKIKILTYKKISIFIVLMAFIGSYIYGPMQFSRNPVISKYLETVDNKETIDKYLHSFPENTKLAVTNNLGAHLSYRNELYLVQFAYEYSDYAIFFMRNPYKVEVEALNKITNDDRFILEFQDNNFYVFKRISP